jgi:hypothetical protein
MCWTINFGCSLNDNEFLYFLAPQQIAQYWMGLEKVWLLLNKIIWPYSLKVVKCIQEQQRCPDRRVVWLKKLYLQLYNELEREAATVSGVAIAGGGGGNAAGIGCGSSFSAGISAGQKKEGDDIGFEIRIDLSRFRFEKFDAI